jgi:hypothetical protein
LNSGKMKKLEFDILVKLDFVDISERTVVFHPCLTRKGILICLRLFTTRCNKDANCKEFYGKINYIISNIYRHVFR